MTRLRAISDLDDATALERERAFLAFYHRVNANKSRRWHKVPMREFDALCESYGLPLVPRDGASA